MNYTTSDEKALNEILQSAYYHVTTSGRPGLDSDSLDKVERAVDRLQTYVTWRCISRFMPEAIESFCSEVDDIKVFDFKYAVEFCLEAWMLSKPSVYKHFYTASVSIEFDVDFTTLIAYVPQDGIALA